MKEPKRRDYFEDDWQIFVSAVAGLLLLEKFFFAFAGEKYYILMLVYSLCLSVNLIMSKIYFFKQNKFNEWHKKYGHLSENELKELEEKEQEKIKNKKLEKFYDGKTKI